MKHGQKNRCNENCLTIQLPSSQSSSTRWELNNVIIRAEVVQLDNTVNNNIVKTMLGGQSLKLVFPMYHTLTQTDFQHSRNRNQYEHSQVFIQTEQWVHHTIQSPTQRSGRWTIQTGQLLLQTLEFLLQPLDGADPDSTPADRGQGWVSKT